ncbi:Tetratricopeptide TPR_1 repeat-containing protein [Thermanaeromonas toyohensis ToBE]|uniref:Tetratricopeptide TPR_1 repeat-containing protein n=1 Tax=Thermanaeromonas toyohensis ToBE TaxID=698762 RepID=A0A1W1VLW1_9FIRM|nr:hypothetical protein [Thermanaeromonas toyohensis]SMB93934.1 Tetratricopeptide TPR_1 repeat-containing protein [Thermanaeromonas toyohensis ToBE]
MGLSLLEYRANNKRALRVVFVGDFFCQGPRAEFNRQLALALKNEGVKLAIVNRGSWEIRASELVELLEQSLPPDYEFCLCWEGEEIGADEQSIVWLTQAQEHCQRGNQQVLSIEKFKIPGRPWQEAARLLKEYLEGLRGKVSEIELSPKRIYVYPPSLSQKVEGHEQSVFGVFKVTEIQDYPSFSSDVEPIVEPMSWVFILEEGEVPMLEDRDSWEKVFLYPPRKLSLLEAIPLELGGLGNLILPSLRLLEGREAMACKEFLEEVPFLYCQQWKPLRLLRSPLLGYGRWERMNRSYLQVKPPYHHRLHLQAVDAAATGKVSEAIAAFKEAYRAAPEPHKALILRNLSLSLISWRRFDEAFLLLEDGIKFYPAYTDLYYLKALAFYQLRCRDELLQVCSKAIEKGEATPWFYSDPGSGSYKAFFLMGEAYYEKGELEKAAAAYYESLFRNPYFLPALERLGRIEFKPKIVPRFAKALAQILDLRHPPTRTLLSQYFGPTELANAGDLTPLL